MMDSRDVAILVIGLGFVVVLVGIIMYAGGLSWFGRLPGDIRIERGNSRFFFPITTMIVISVGLSLLLAVLRRLL
jgi:predicted cobalt transporter CbtA